jgi:hypothetical protein
MAAIKQSVSVLIVEFVLLVGKEQQEILIEVLSQRDNREMEVQLNELQAEFVIILSPR